MLHIPPTKSTHLLTAQTKKDEPHKRAYLSEKGGLGKKDQENGPKAEKDKAEIVTGLGRRTREEK